MDGECHCNIVLANVKGVKEPWAVITDEEPSLKTLWQYGLRFRVEELFLDFLSGAFQLEESRIRSPQALERLYLVVALALLFATTQGMAVQISGLRTQVDPHCQRGLSYLKIGLRWLKGVLNKGGHLAWGSPRRSCCPCRALWRLRSKRTKNNALAVQFSGQIRAKLYCLFFTEIFEKLTFLYQLNPPKIRPLKLLKFRSIFLYQIN